MEIHYADLYEYVYPQVRAVSAKYTMKCDDDTFIRVDSVLAEARKIPGGKSFYIGNINYYHQPLRFGKWAVTYEVQYLVFSPISYFLPLIS